MNIAGKVVVVTGGANGIGRALCRRLAVEGAKTVLVADLDGDGAKRVAKEIGGMAVQANVGHETDVQRLVQQAIEKHGVIDLFCSNAGILTAGGIETPDDVWQRIWSVNVMAHIYAARAVLPHMLARSEGYLLQTVSAAGLLTILGSAPYAVTKHASLAFAEWLAITYGERGIKVSAVCPMGVRTDMLKNDKSGPVASLADPVIEPEQLAEAVIEGLAEERFLILPNREVVQRLQDKASDYDRWLQGMRYLRAQTLKNNAAMDGPGSHASR